MTLPWEGETPVTSEWDTQETFKFELMLRRRSKSHIYKEKMCNKPAKVWIMPSFPKAETLYSHFSGKLLQFQKDIY